MSSLVKNKAPALKRKVIPVESELKKRLYTKKHGFEGDEFDPRYDFIFNFMLNLSFSVQIYHYTEINLKLLFII